MTIRNRITEISLWVFIISLGILIGATVFEALVITPLWAGSPPESVRGWNENPRYAIEIFSRQSREESNRKIFFSLFPQQSCGELNQ